MHATLVITKEKDQTVLKVFIQDAPYPTAQILLADHYNDVGVSAGKLSVTVRDWANVTTGIDYPIPA